MKRFIKYTCAVLAVGALGSCGADWLNRMPEDAVPTELAVLNYKDGVTSLNGVYDGMQRNEYYGARMIVYGEVRGDLMQASASGKRTSSLYEMSYNAQASPEIWAVPYNQIRRANNLIKSIKEGNANEGGTVDQVNVLHGQALALRALAHFDLVRVYGKPYTVDNGASFGVPVVLEPTDPSSKPGRSTVHQVYEQVIVDLKEAIQLLATSSTRSASNGKVNLWVAKTLLARVYLYKGENGLAYDLAKDVIDNSPYTLLTNAGYAAAWASGAENSEMMFQIINTSNDNADREGLSYLMNEEGYEDMIATVKQVSYMAANATDVRGALYIPSHKEENVKLFGAATVWVNKYPGVGGDSRINNVPVVRLSEAYLIAAEAAFKKGDMSNASLYLNAIAKRNPALGTVTPSLEAVMEQRGVELIGEGHRFFDLMRNNLNSDRTARWSYTFAVSESINFNNTYFRAILPIPVAEMDVNETIKEQQNLGY